MKAITVSIKLNVHSTYTLKEIRAKIVCALENDPVIEYFLPGAKISAHLDHKVAPRKHKAKHSTSGGFEP